MIVVPDQNEDQEIRLVTFALHGEQYALDVRQVREIISVDDTQASDVVSRHAHASHMIDLRGTPVPVISLRQRFGFPEAPNADTHCIAVMDFAGELVGFVFDDIIDVIRIRRQEVKPMISALARPYVEGVVSFGNRLGIFLNPRTLA